MSKSLIVCGVVIGLVGMQALSVAEAGPVLAWTGSEKDPHPCLYITANDVVRIRQTRPDLVGLTGEMDWAPGRNGLDDLIAAALIADNTGAAKAVAANVLMAMDELLAKAPATIQKNEGPHAYARQFGVAVGLADAALAGKCMTPEDRASLLSKIAQVGYLLHDPGYWNLEAGGGNLCPNMKTSAEGYRLTIAALIPSHPLAKTWFDGALKRLKQELDDWTDPAGGMIECPHYSMVILDQWVAAFLIARNAGAADDGHLFDPKLRQAIEWFGNISTPRDPRNNGFRRLPSLGHTYANERSGMFGTMACLWREKDPAFAAQMAWMHEEHGKFGEPGILSYYPGLMGYRIFFKESGVPPKPPTWGSTCYPETGVQLRNMIGGERETALYMIAGRNHSHYFNDSGSITLWGKGRELCDDDDYQKRRSKESREAHSMPDKPATFNEERVMALQEFSTTASLDYVRGTRRGWQRQIAFVKDADPLAPNYFVIADTLDDKSVPTTWRLFLMAERIVPTAAGVTVVGKDDVDMDIVFLRPDKVKPQIHSNHVSVAVSAPGTLSVLLYPRLKTETPPQVTPLEGGKGVQVIAAGRTDYVFLDSVPLAYSKAGVSFEGKVGLVQLRNGKPQTFQPGPCDVAPGWEGGDRELRTIRWKGPQYPLFPDEEAK